MAGPCTITTTVTVKVTITNIERSTRSTICAICCHSALTTSRLSCSFWRLSLFSIVEHTFCSTWRNWCSNLSKSGKCDNGKLFCKVHGIRPFCLGISLFTQYFDEGWISSLFLASCKIKCYHGYLLIIIFFSNVIDTTLYFFILNTVDILQETGTAYPSWSPGFILGDCWGPYCSSF